MNLLTDFGESAIEARRESMRERNGVELPLKNFSPTSLAGVYIYTARDESRGGGLGVCAVRVNRPIFDEAGSTVG